MYIVHEKCTWNECHVHVHVHDDKEQSLRNEYTTYIVMNSVTNFSIVKTTCTV